MQGARDALAPPPRATTASPAAAGARCRTRSTTRSSNGRRPLAWANWQRSEDYYSEGQLIWLDVDTKIREKSGDKRSLDDFARPSTA
jgi:predicted metalloprotease with PDZ domain